MTYPALACGQKGVSYITQPFKGGDTLHLALNGGANFPSLEDQQFFYALLVDPCRTRCISVKVIATQGDTFSVASVATDCFPAGSKLHFDDNSVAALQERLPGLIREVNNPLVFANGKLMLDWDTFKEAFQEVLLSAQAPLQYDAQSGNLTLDVDALFNDQKSKILGWLSATAPLEYDETNGVFSIDIAGLKTALGITT